MSKFKDEIINLGKNTLLNNRDIARIVGCSTKTVSRYAGSFSERCKFKTADVADPFEIQKTVLLPDIHHPHYEERVMDAVGQFIMDYDPDELVYMGDQMSLDCISGWNKKKPLNKEGQRLIKDYLEFDKDVLQVHESITRPETRRTFMIGNHEQRIQWYVEAYPELEGMLDIDSHLGLSDRGYQIIPFNGIYEIGKLKVIHGFYWNMYHAKKHVEVFEGNVVYAHVHNPQLYSKVSPIDSKGYHMATGLPCLCNIKPDYKKNAPNFWVNGFGVVEHLPASGFFNLYVVIIIEGAFMWNGSYYGKDI